MSMNFNFTVFGEKQVSRTILRVGEHAGDPVPLWFSFFEDLAQIEEEQFDSEGGSQSGGWAALADTTIEAKALAGLDPRILHATLALRESLTEAHGGEDAVRIAEQSFMVFGSSVPYGKFHQTGTVNMPQRRPVEVSMHTRRLLMKKLQRWIIKGEILPI